MNNTEYVAWLELYCPIGVGTENFVFFLAMKSIEMIELSSKETGRKIPFVIYELTERYKNFYKG